MKRKVIQIADSTQLVSLPRKWAIEHNIKKGDELTLELNGATLIVHADSKPIVEKAEIDLAKFGVMANRVIYALYKKGVDEIKIHMDKTADFKIVQESLQNKTVGFEVVEQGNNHCVIKNISGQTEEFDSVLRRIFLLLTAMSSDGLSALRKKDFVSIKNITSMEETNNRLTQICRRYINKVGKVNYSKIGPLYFIVEALEKVADEFKYMFQYVSNVNASQINLSKEFFDIYAGVDEMIKNFYSLFYKFDVEKLAEIGSQRKTLVPRCINLMQKNQNKHEVLLTHHLFVVQEKIFDMTGPFMIIGL